MKKVIFEPKIDQVNVSDLKNSDIVGFIDNNGDKGYIVNIGSDKLCAVSVRRGIVMPNRSYGLSDKNTCENIHDALDIYKRCDCKISQAFVFENQKELHKWLSE